MRRQNGQGNEYQGGLDKDSFTGKQDPGYLSDLVEIKYGQFSHFNNCETLRLKLYLV